VTCAALAAGVGASTAGSAPAEYGTGLRLGKVVHSIPVGASVGPWLRWNRSTCSYEVAKQHPKAYAANIRKVAGGATKIGYMNYGDTDPFGVANSKNVKEMASLAGFGLDVYNLKYPSESEPLTQARNAVTKKDAGVMQAQQIDTLTNAFLKILQKDGCIPSVQMYLRIPNVPSFGAVWADVGTTQGQWMAREAKRRGWEPKDTAFISCTDPTVGASVNIMFDTSYKALLAGGYSLPKSSWFKLVCKYSQTESAQVRVGDWLTSHPNFKHIMINSIDDERAQGEINALRQAGRLDAALVVGTGTDDLGKKQIRAGQEHASVAFFPERYGEWLLPLLQDVMAGNPVPSFVGSQLVVITKANIDKYYKG
jgi:ribose transport system substrate-binding protein